MRGIRRIQIDLEGIAKSSGCINPLEFLPHPRSRPPAESIRTSSFYSQGYLDALRCGACPLIVENDAPVLLMPKDDAHRYVEVYRWHLAARLAGHQPAPGQGPLPGVDVTGLKIPPGFHAWVIPWGTVAFPLPIGGGLSAPVEKMVQYYRVLCAERESAEDFAVLTGRFAAARRAVDHLISTIHDDGRHDPLESSPTIGTTETPRRNGAIWPELRASLADPMEPIAEAYVAYKRDYRWDFPTQTLTQALEVFWFWAWDGCQTGQIWTGWNGMYDAPEGPLAHGPLPAPYVVLWSPGWGHPAANLAAAASAASFAHAPPFLPQLEPESVTLRSLERQRIWLAVAETAAQAIANDAQRLRPTSHKGGRPEDVHIYELVRFAKDLGQTATQLAELVCQRRSEFPDFAGLSNTTIKERIRKRWMSSGNNRPHGPELLP